MLEGAQEGRAVLSRLARAQAQKVARCQPVTPSDRGRFVSWYGPELRPDAFVRDVQASRTQADGRLQVGCGAVAGNDERIREAGAETRRVLEEEASRPGVAAGHQEEGCV